MKIDYDIVAFVQRLKPETLGQRVAMEQTLQRKRDAGGLMQPVIAVMKPDWYHPTVEQLDDLWQELTGV